MNDIGRKRAELKARIKKARANLDYVKRCESDLAKQAAMLQKKKAQFLRVAPFAKGALVARSNESIALAEAVLATAAKSVAAGMETATQLLQALHDELDGLAG